MSPLLSPEGDRSTLLKGGIFVIDDQRVQHLIARHAGAIDEILEQFERAPEIPSITRPFSVATMLDIHASYAIVS